MKKHLALVILATPITALLACGTRNQDQQNLTEQENTFLAAASSADESEELVADQVEELSALLDFEDDSSDQASVALGLTREKDSSLEKACKLVDGKIVLNKDKSKSKELDKTTRKGRIEVAVSRESSFERIYSPAPDKELAVNCKTENGPIKFLIEKISNLPGSKAEAKHARKSERSLKIDGVEQRGRSSNSQGSRVVQFTAASQKDGMLIINKSVSFSSTASVSRIEKGQNSLMKNERKTVEESPLKIQVTRDAASGKLVHKLIESGHVQISRDDDRKIDVVYEKVKFTAECKPESGRLLVTRTQQEGDDKSARVLSIRFVDGEALVSRDGGAEKKMDSLNLRLETCRK